jgi:hypothetical protein
MHKLYIFSQFIAPTCFGHFWPSSGCAVTEYSNEFFQDMIIYNINTSSKFKFNIVLFPCILSLLQPNSMHILGKKVCLIIVHCISIWAEVSQSNVMYANKVQCWISICTSFAIISKFAIFRADGRGEGNELRKWWCKSLLRRCCT